MRFSFLALEGKDEELERINKRKLEELLRMSTSQKEQQQAPTPTDGKPEVLTDSSFYQELTRHPLVVVDFWAPWCGPCRMIAPIIEQLAKEYAGKVFFGKLNVDENPLVANQFQVRSIPTILIFKEGRAVDGVLGAVPKSVLEAKLRPFLSGQAGSKSSSSLTRPYG